jgi:hypothetical protein
MIFRLRRSILLLFLEKGFKNKLFTNTFEKGCTSDAEVSDVQLSR